MNVPSFLNIRFVDETGFLTSEAQLFMASLNQSMLAALSEDGWTIPQQTTDGIAEVESVMPIGTIWFNTTLAKLQVKTADGVIETITSA